MEVNFEEGGKSYYFVFIGIELVDCGDPGVPVNGRRIGDNFHLGATVNYECDEGFQPTGPLSRVCLSTGLWDGFLLTCIPISKYNQIDIFQNQKDYMYGGASI